MDQATIRKQALKFHTARRNLLSVVCFTALNLLLTAIDAGIYFPFSATVPQFAFEVGKGLAGDLQNNTFLFIGLFIAVILAALYLVCWFFAKRTRGFIAVALVFFSLDSLLFLFIIFISDFELSLLLDVAFHGWVLFSLISGTIAWAKLRKVSVEEINAVLTANPASPAAIWPGAEQGGGATAAQNVEVAAKATAEPIGEPADEPAAAPAAEPVDKPTGESD